MVLLKSKKPKKPNKRNYADPLGPRYADLTICKSSPADVKALKVVSYNIKYSKKISSAIKLFKAHHELREAQVLCLQEMTGEAVEIIAQALGYNYVYYPAVFHSVLKKDFGNAILSRLPIIADEKVILPHLDPSHTQRTVVNAAVEFNNKRVIISNVHFKVLINPKFRSDQVQYLLRSMPKNESHFVIAGDFNTFTKANSKAILEPLIEADYLPATDGIGWSHKHWTLMNKKSQLDHIFIKGLALEKTGKVIDRKSSDHIPIWVDVAFSALENKT